MTHPESIPQTRVCPGCGLRLQLSADLWPTRKGEPYRYPWTPSYYRSPCKACTAQRLRDLNAATKTARSRSKDAKRRRDRKAAKADPLYNPDNIRNVGGERLLKGLTAKVRQSRATKANQAAKAKAKAQAKAWVGHIMPRLPYDPAADPIKIKIRLESQAAMRRRLQASPFLQRLAQGLPEPSEGPGSAADPLDALRARAARGWRQG